jgi:hypothetical protein
LKNIETWCAVATLGALTGKEYLDWVWWCHWEDDEDERHPAPLLCSTWAVWQLIGQARFWLWMGLWHPLECWLDSIRGESPPFQLPPEPTDKDGRTPAEWLAIEVIGIWNLECWYKGEYDWEVKRKWDESLKSAQAHKDSEAEELASLKHAH